MAYTETLFSTLWIGLGERGRIGEDGIGEGRVGWGRVGWGRVGWGRVG